MDVVSATAGPGQAAGPAVTWPGKLRTGHRGPGQPQAERRAGTGFTDDVDASSGQPGPLAEQPQPDVTTPDTGDRRHRSQSDAPVADRRQYMARIDLERHLRRVDVGVLDHVEQRLLEEAVDRDRCGQRNRVFGVGPRDRHSSP